MSFFDLPYSFILCIFTCTMYNVDVVNTIFNSWYARVYGCQIMESLFLCFFVSLYSRFFSSSFYRSSHVKAHWSSFLLRLYTSQSLYVFRSHTHFPSTPHSSILTQIVYTQGLFGEGFNGFKDAQTPILKGNRTQKGVNAECCCLFNFSLKKAPSDSRKIQVTLVCYNHGPD